MQWQSHNSSYSSPTTEPRQGPCDPSLATSTSSAPREATSSSSKGPRPTGRHHIGHKVVTPWRGPFRVIARESDLRSTPSEATHAANSSFYLDDPSTGRRVGRKVPLTRLKKYTNDGSFSPAFEAPSLKISVASILADSTDIAAHDRIKPPDLGLQAMAALGQAPLPLSTPPTSQASGASTTPADDSLPTPRELQFSSAGPANAPLPAFNTPPATDEPCRSGRTTSAPNPAPPSG